MNKHVRNLIIALVPLCMVTTTQAQLDVFKRLGKAATESTKQIAYFKVKGAVAETPTGIPPLFGNEPPVSLKSLLERLKEARLDNNVVAVVIDLQHAAPGFAQLQELHIALRKFAAVDKDVYVHADRLSNGTFALATGATHISMVPTGNLWLIGLFAETPYLRGALDKIGCIPDFEHCGSHKTGAESITNTEPSEASREMTNWLLDSIYDEFVAIIAEGRSKTKDAVRKLIDRGPFSAEEALEAGLIDSVQHRQDFIADIKKRYGESTEVAVDYGKRDSLAIPEDPFAMISWFMKILNPSPKVYTDPSVAIVYVEGAISTGEAESSPFGGSTGAKSTTIRKALDKAAADDSVKAVVLRVDSPGGSALASEIILDATKRVAAKKPLVVSMGNVAGSGGYYVTCAAETIFADPATITASIGVLGGKIVTTGMWDKLGINWVSHQRGEMAGMLASDEKFSDVERKRIRHYMENVYEIFKKHVTDARGSRLTKPIEEMAGGRVYTGRQAMELGLIDKFGGLEDAIKFAAKTAQMGEYDIRVIPEPATIFDLFGGNKGKGDEFTSMSLPMAFSGSREPLGLVNAGLFKTMLPLVAAIDPLRAQAIFRTLQKIELVHQEGVIMMMPDELLIR